MKKLIYLNKRKRVLLIVILNLFIVKNISYGQSKLLCGDLDQSSITHPEIRHNITDIVILVDYILELGDRECPSLADINKDHHIDVSDIDNINPDLYNKINQFIFC